ncbi:unnamed protein product [Camellia sinensis]
MEILVAWSKAMTMSRLEGDTRLVQYNIDLGTSMSYPHAIGAAAYMKSFRLKWPSTAIKPVLMATASRMSAETNNDAEFAYGAGYINPVKAANPSLVYDIEEADYVRYLCG